ncbi:MAG: pyridoxamine 5'-phosphate oxidase family protein [Chloroflexota bacterium]|nr:pyridoxamine 5'-phosphate oxidase family protein [Chloroflexota bacterium]
MYSEEARAFLERPLIARLATIDDDGYPHNVPLWYLLDGDDILIISDRATRKTKNVLARPQAAIAIGGDPADGTGYMIRGDVTVEEDADKAVTRRMTYRYEPKDEAERLLDLWKNDDIIILRLKPKSVVKVY